MEEVKVAAIVLNAYPAKEADLVLVLLCHELGKIRAFAKGARKSKKRFFGNIEIFTEATFNLKRKPESELYQIENLENKNTPVALRNSLNHFLILSICYELTNKCTADFDTDSKLYFTELQHLTKVADRLFPMEKFIPLTVFYLLRLGQTLGIDPISHNSSFRSDDSLWFKQMIIDKTPLKYEPPAASLRAFQTLCNYLANAMEVNINSLDSLSILKLS